MKDSKIEWTDATWNPIRGCSMVSAGCENCYALGVSHRFGGEGQPYEGLTRSTPHGPKWTGKIRLVPEKLDEPLRWTKPRRIFVNSMSDLFHPEVPDEYIDRVFAVMALAQHHTFQVLTKRPERMAEYLNMTFGVGCNRELAILKAMVEFVGKNAHFKGRGFTAWLNRADRVLPLPNVWLGTSVENQAAADERIPHLLRTPAAGRFLSCEPLLGPVDLGNVDFDGATSLCVLERPPWQIHQVIVGGESGPGARPMHPDWARDLRDQCVEAGVPYFFKQWGAWAPINQPWKEESPDPLLRIERWVNLAGGSGFHGDEVWRMARLGKKAAGRLLDGREWNEAPEVKPGGTFTVHGYNRTSAPEVEG